MGNGEDSEYEAGRDTSPASKRSRRACEVERAAVPVEAATDREETKATFIRSGIRSGFAGGGWTAGIAAAGTGGAAVGFCVTADEVSRRVSRPQVSTNGSPCRGQGLANMLRLASTHECVRHGLIWGDETVSASGARL